MPEKNYSWKNSPNAGLVLAILALVCGLGLFVFGFS